MVNIVQKGIPGLIVPSVSHPTQFSRVFNIPTQKIPKQDTPIQTEFKLHTAMRDGSGPSDPLGRDPYSVLMYGDGSEWLQWNRNSPPREPYDRKYIFSIVRMPRTKTIWIFGGIFVVQGGPYHVPKGSPVPKGSHASYPNNRYEYDIYPSALGRGLVGKMIIGLKKPNIPSKKSVRFDLEKCIGGMRVLKIYP